MAAGSDTRRRLKELGQPISARPSAGPGRMMMVGADDGSKGDDPPSDDENTLNDNATLASMSVAEIRSIVREELLKKPS